MVLLPDLPCYMALCCENLQAEVLASDCMRLPYRSGVFDAAISIAVLHHFSSEVRIAWNDCVARGDGVV